MRNFTHKQLCLRLSAACSRHSSANSRLWAMAAQPTLRRRRSERHTAKAFGDVRVVTETSPLSWHEGVTVTWDEPTCGTGDPKPGSACEEGPPTEAALTAHRHSGTTSKHHSPPLSSTTTALRIQRDGIFFLQSYRPEHVRSHRHEGNTGPVRVISAWGRSCGHGSEVNSDETGIGGSERRLCATAYNHSSAGPCP